jgi:signal transduction histidine kinase
VTEQMREPLLKVLREALSNVVRHARATQVQITAAVDEGRFTLTVDDDGLGMSAVDTRSGLDNARARAQALGGDLELTTSPLGGARLVWSVPLAR